MGSLLGDLPSFDPQNFSQISVSDPAKPTRTTPVTYQPTHDRSLPPPDQVISSESKNILIRHFYQPTHEKLRLKRVANESLMSEHETKHPRAHDPGSLG